MSNTDFDAATTVLDDIAGDYTIDPAHTRLGFSARHAMVATVRGSFKEFTGTAHVDTATPANSKVERDGDDWTITGDLTIKDVTKPITIEFESNGSARDPFGNLRIGFEGGTSINRKDWDLTWNAALETGGVLVSEKIKLEFDISAIQA